MAIHYGNRAKGMKTVSLQILLLSYLVAKVSSLPAGTSVESGDLPSTYVGHYDADMYSVGSARSSTASVEDNEYRRDFARYTHNQDGDLSGTEAMDDDEGACIVNARPTAQRPPALPVNVPDTYDLDADVTYMLADNTAGHIESVIPLAKLVLDEPPVLHSSPLREDTTPMWVDEWVVSLCSGDGDVQDMVDTAGTAPPAARRATLESLPMHRTRNINGGDSIAHSSGSRGSLKQ
ncbi:hypothetical protein SeLEV6574_g08279 [Synchytrium endobioticum]|uniref:Uncharacterized protein n=1 Tax=Synchytrium endobioticum TaxID=286115 RepID=A0A507CAP7_9FUNG|nr:hypothetical protein SeLEV6574_g08279 [Synchytrium endobioticum]